MGGIKGREMADPAKLSSYDLVLPGSAISGKPPYKMAPKP